MLEMGDQAFVALNRHMRIMADIPEDTTDPMNPIMAPVKTEVTRGRRNMIEQAPMIDHGHTRAKDRLFAHRLAIVIMRCVSHHPGHVQHHQRMPLDLTYAANRTFSHQNQYHRNRVWPSTPRVLL
jgi:hypothetical protein